ncbi:YesL family protein [Halalkalibacter kiskunsagensis]|uniref:YesL family protein n=1 Tax=Halalkalibacter kiskunsagensis TaxID=1548599 RepID=A0ABV6KC38_9BACI
MVNLNGIFKWLYDLGNWLAKIMYLHFLWIAFTLVGLVVFGISPATAALVSVIHKWFDEDLNIPIFKNFYSVYKKQFMKSNGLGAILIGFGLFLYGDYQISQQFIQSFYFHAFLLIISFLYLITFLYFFTIFARYELKFFYYFIQSFLIAIARPFETIAMIISLFLLSFLFNVLPILFLFMGTSLIFYPLVWFSYRACLGAEEKKDKLSNEQLEISPEGNRINK